MRLMREWRLAMVVGALACVVVAAGPAATTGPASGEAVLGYLDRVIDWYRQVQGAGEAAGSSQELVAREGAREDARRVVGLAFDFGRAAAALIEENGGAPAATMPAAVGSRGKTLAQLAAGAADRAARLEGDVARAEREIAAGAATTRPSVAVERDRLAAQLDLARAQRDVLREYAGFVTTAENGGTGRRWRGRSRIWRRRCRR